MYCPLINDECSACDHDEVGGYWCEVAEEYIDQLTECPEDE